MAGKMELKDTAEKLKAAGLAERECIDWESTGIEYMNGVNTKEYGKKAPKKNTK